MSAPPAQQPENKDVEEQSKSIEGAATGEEQEQPVPEDQGDAGTSGAPGTDGASEPTTQPAATESSKAEDVEAKQDDTKATPDEPVGDESQSTAAQQQQEPAAAEQHDSKLSSAVGEGETKTATTADTTMDEKVSEESATQPASTTPAVAKTPATPTGTKPATKPAASQRDTPSSKPAQKKKRSGLAAFLSCLPCVGGDAHDDDAHDAAERRRRAEAARAKSEKQTAAKPKSEEKVEEKVKQPTGDAAGGTTQAASPETTSAQDLSTAAIVANASSSGAQLPHEMTEGVTSAAVQNPGAGASPISTPEGSSAPAGVPDTSAGNSSGEQTARKQRKKKKAAGSGTENVITSVEEPGGGLFARGAGVVAAAPPTAAAAKQRDDDSSEGELETDEDDEEIEDIMQQQVDEDDVEQDLIARGGVGIPIGEDGVPRPLLAELAPDLKGRKCLVLDLDETLVHSSFRQMTQQADYVVPVEIENQFHNVFVIKRPGVDYFLEAMGKLYEIVVFTASLSKYADPVLDQLDVHCVVKHRLFRESCYNNKGNYVKDLSQLGRPLGECIIIDNSPASYVFHPNNAVPISSWFNDPHDTELTDLVPFLTDLETVDDIRSVLDGGLYDELLPPPPSASSA